MTDKHLRPQTERNYPVNSGFWLYNHAETLSGAEKEPIKPCNLCQQ